ncbi:MAG: PAS domain S-box protein [Steroidobacteraceae bacterium]
MTRSNVASPQDTMSDVDLTVALETSRANFNRLEAHFRATIEQLPIGIAHTDIEDRITLFNTAFCSMLGFGAEELTGKRFAEITYPDDIEGSRAVRQRMWLGEVPFYAIEKRYIKKDGTILWARVTVAPFRNVDGTLEGAIGILEDITLRKEAEAEVERVHQELMLAAREAGMAEIASNVLHNVGNVLNSLNISASLLTGHVRGSKVDAFGRVVALLQENGDRLGTFLTEDVRGKHVREFLVQLSTHMLSNQRSSLDELQSLSRNIEHIKQIVATQQTYAKRCGIRETVDVESLVEDSLAINRGAFARHSVALRREFAKVPQITIEKHKVLQILVNLERNAKDACDASERDDKNITVRISARERGVQIQVIDNGVGISLETMQRLFTQGFTTKKEAHGFGLHGSALAAQELGGALEAASEGLGCGATFTLTLPWDAPEQRHR